MGHSSLHLEVLSGFQTSRVHSYPHYQCPKTVLQRERMILKVHNYNSGNLPTRPSLDIDTFPLRHTLINKQTCFKQDLIVNLPIRLEVIHYRKPLGPKFSRVQTSPLTSNGRTRMMRDLHFERR